MLGIATPLNQFFGLNPKRYGQLADGAGLCTRFTVLDSPDDIVGYVGSSG
jgi:hypothetical protein